MVQEQWDHGFCKGQGKGGTGTRGNAFSEGQGRDVKVDAFLKSPNLAAILQVEGTSEEALTVSKRPKRKKSPSFSKSGDEVSSSNEDDKPSSNLLEVW